MRTHYKSKFDAGHQEEWKRLLSLEQKRGELGLLDSPARKRLKYENLFNTPTSKLNMPSSPKYSRNSETQTERFLFLSKILNRE